MAAEAAAAAAEAADAERLRAERLAAKAERLPPEPAAGGADVVQVLIRMPGGQRLNRRRAAAAHMFHGWHWLMRWLYKGLLHIVLFCTRRNTVGGRLRRRLSCSVCRPNLPLSISCEAPCWLVALRYTLLQLSSAMCCCPAPRYLKPVCLYLRSCAAPRFLKSDKVQALYDFVDTGGPGWELPPDSYLLVTNMPRKVSCWISSPSLITAACNSAWRARCKAALCPEMLPSGVHTPANQL